MKSNDALKVAFASERTPRSLMFVIEGNPIPLQRPRMSGSHCWDSQKQEKMIISLDLADQLDDEDLFAGPLEVDFTFYMPMPKRASMESKMKTIGKHHTTRPDTDNLIKMYLDCASNGILFKDDCLIAIIHAKKIYDVEPRTLIMITEIL